ncbi:TrbG/VirB9 family P-type conjugative transfer protein [Phaeobacter italicus]|uniref:TrbG/VirB9 family P-type conjugative transfer protein n=1 Tax=Phaeobacter italicus TaxID=481446 RepID=UPI001ADB637B|nr:TrbG/VirB9 family P-type conjugative transfer protein [Phaeobacter italicus]MBO9443908.1 TrbG/VirB9 family P-type conjugative transfer protein [Phaeobacter italicus]
MNLLPPLLLALALPAAALAEATPKGGPLDIRIRYATYNENQVFRIETDLRHSTTIHFGRGERFEAVIVGDTESFQVDPIPELGNVLTIKPHVARASTNMTVITNRRSYSFHLREGSIPNRTGMFFEVRFLYPEDERRTRTSTPKGFEAPRNYAYLVSGESDFRPGSVYDDGRYTYFTFPENTRQPAIFKADDQGRERTVNWTQDGNTVRVLGVNDYWTLRIDDEALCIARDSTTIYVSN